MLMMIRLACLMLWCWVKRGSPDAHDAGACLPPADGEALMLMMQGLASLLLWCWLKRGSPDAHDAGACLPPAVVLGETGKP